MNQTTSGIPTQIALEVCPMSRGLMSSKPHPLSPHHFGGEIAGSREVVRELGRCAFVGFVLESISIDAVCATHPPRGFRSALRGAFQETLAGVEANSEARTVRGWKLLLVLPRLLLYRPPRGGTVPRKKLEARLRQFQEGDWLSSQPEFSSLFSAGAGWCRQTQTSEPRRGSHKSSTRVVLGAFGRTLRRPPSFGRCVPRPGQSRIPTGDPPVPRQGLSQEIRRSQPHNPFALESLELLICLRKARRGAAPGPSGGIRPLVSNSRERCRSGIVRPS